MILLTFNSIAQESISIRQKDSIRFMECYRKVCLLKDADYKKAYKIAKDYLNENKSTSYGLGNVAMLVNLAEIEYLMMFRFDKSIAHVNEMRKLGDSLGIKVCIPWSELLLGNLYFAQKDYAKSMIFYQKAKKNFTIYNDTLLYINALNGIANVFALDKLTRDTALTILYDSKNNITKTISKESLIYIYESVGNIYLLKEIPDSSIKYFKLSQKYSKLFNNQLFTLNSEIYLTYLNYKKHKLYNPIHVLKNYQDSCRIKEYYYLYSIVGYMISEVLENKGQYRESLFVYKETKEIEDSIFSIEKIRNVSEIDSDYTLKEKESENKELQRINEINSLKLKNRKIFITFIIFILIQAIVLLYLLYKKYLTIKEQERKIFEHEKEKIAQKLDYKKRELAISTLKMFHINQLLDDLSSRLNILRSKIRLRGNPGEELRNYIQSMLNDIRFSNNNKIWEELKVNFNDSKPDFFKWLYDTYPSLTLNEVKLCVFSMLHLKTKDICSILLKTELSVQVARTRLRKKLEINDQGTSLSAFLNAKYYEFFELNNEVYKERFKHME